MPVLDMGINRRVNRMDKVDCRIKSGKDQVAV